MTPETKLAHGHEINKIRMMKFLPTGEVCLTVK